MFGARRQALWPREAIRRHWPSAWSPWCPWWPVRSLQGGKRRTATARLPGSPPRQRALAALKPRCLQSTVLGQLVSALAENLLWIHRVAEEADTSLETREACRGP